MAKKLFIGNISYDTPEENIRALFEAYDSVTEVAIPKDRNYPDRHRGICFVTFDNDEQADQARQDLHGKEVDGRPLRVDEARPPQPREHRSYE